MKIKGVLIENLRQFSVVGGRDKDMVVRLFLTKEMVLGLVEERSLNLHLWIGSVEVEDDTMEPRVAPSFAEAVRRG